MGYKAALSLLAVLSLLSVTTSTAHATNGIAQTTLVLVVDHGAKGNVIGDDKKPMHLVMLFVTLPHQGQQASRPLIEGQDKQQDTLSTL